MVIGRVGDHLTVALETGTTMARAAMVGRRSHTRPPPRADTWPVEDVGPGAARGWHMDRDGRRMAGDGRLGKGRDRLAGGRCTADRRREW
jgi:hypothetical protein